MKKNFINILLSLLSTIGIIYNYEINNNILIVLIFYLYFNYINRIKYKDKNKVIYSFLYTICLSTIVYIGKYYEYEMVININVLFILKYILLNVSLFPFVYKIYDSIPKLSNSKKSEYKINKIKIFITLSIVGLIYYVLLYPGVYGYDSGYQIAQFMENNIKITTSFSLINSYIMYFFVMIGKSIFNSYTIGLSFYTLIQMLFINYVVAKLISYVYNNTKNIILLNIFIIFYILFPMHHILSISTCQDVFYAGFMTLLGIELYEYINNSANNLLYIVIYSLLLCLSRNNGIHVIMICLLLILIFLKNRRKDTTIIIIFILTLNFIINSAVINIFKASKSESLREMLSIPSQQIINVYTYQYENLSDETKKSIEIFYPGESKQYYNVRQSISDISKGALDTDFTKNHIFDYAKLYIKLAIKYPKNYINAFLLNTLGLWYPEKNYYDSRMYHPYIEVEMLDAHMWNKEYIEINRKPLINSNNVIEKIINNNSWQKVPILSLFYKGGVYFLISLFIIIYNIYKKTYTNLLSISILFAQYLILILSPVILFRYIYSIIIYMPLTIMTIYPRKKR